MFNGRGLFGNVYEGRRVLVTGHTGFKGSWLALWLQAMGASVSGFALEPPTQPSLFEELGLERRLTHIIGDIRDERAVDDAVAACRPEIVFHLAAQPIVRHGYAEPRLTYETNVMGTVNLLEAVRRTPGVRAVVNITSDKCYENREWEYAYRENDAMGGYDPYSSSKGCAELVTAAYRSSFLAAEGIQLASARAGNVIGGGDWAADRLLPDCFRALAAGEEILVRNPAAIRPWQFVLEPLAGYLQLAGRLFSGESRFAGGWNFGPGSSSQVPVRQVVDLVLEQWGSGGWQSPPAGAAGARLGWQGQAAGAAAERAVKNAEPLAAEAAVKAEPHEAECLKLDCSRANNILSWHPLYDIEGAVRVTTAWYRSRAEGRDVLQLSLRQIEDYVAAAIGGQSAWAMTGVEVS